MASILRSLKIKYEKYTSLKSTKIMLCVDRSFCLQVVYSETVTPLQRGHCYEQQFRSPRVPSR